MENTRSARIQTAFLKYFHSEKKKPLQRRCFDQAMTPLWMLQSITTRALRFLEMGRTPLENKSHPKDRSELASGRRQKPSPNSSNLEEKILEHLTEGAVKFLNAEAKDKAKMGGEWVPPLALMAFTGRIPGIKAMLGFILNRIGSRKI